MASILAEMSKTIDELRTKGRGILAADESTGTIGKRFDSIGIENTESNRQHYRSLLATTKDLGSHICGVILFEETLKQKVSDGLTIPQAFAEQGIVPGIKVDKGLIPFNGNLQDKITEGLDGLAARLIQYKELGARFAKWRNVFNVSSTYVPSFAAIVSNAEVHARYASI